jgi:hypothetical protein
VSAFASSFQGSFQFRLLQLLVGLALQLAGLALGLTLELLGLALCGTGKLLGLTLGLSLGLGCGVLDGFSDLLYMLVRYCLFVLRRPSDCGTCATGMQQTTQPNGADKERSYSPPFSMPFTAAPEIVLSTAFAASLMVSTGLLRAMGVVLNRRA